jgi:hypothetical protein
VSERVVHGLEVVEIDEQNGKRLTIAKALRDAVPDPVLEQRPVWKTGERIVECLVTELVLKVLALAHVAKRDDEPADRRILQEVRTGAFDIDEEPVLTENSPLGGRGGLRLGPSGAKRGRREMAIPRVYELQERSADQVIGAVADDPLHGWGREENPSTRIDEQQKVGGVLPERSGATFADGGLGGASLRPEDPHEEDDHEQPGEER